MRSLSFVLTGALLWVIPAHAVVFQYGGTAVGTYYVNDSLDGDEAYITNPPATAKIEFTSFIPTKDGGYYPTRIDYGDVATVTVHFPDQWSWLEPNATGYDWVVGLDFQTDIVIDAGKIISFSHSTFIDTEGTDIIGGITLSGTSDEWTFAPYGNGGFSASLKPGFVRPTLNMDLNGGGGLQHISWTYFAVDSLENVGVTFVPEPYTWALMFAGLTIVGCTVRQKKPTLSF